VATILALSRYYATTLVTWGRSALAAGETSTARRHAAWALRLNPLSFSAHQLMANAHIRSGDLAEAVAASEHAVRIAPLDPNNLFLAGEIALAAGRWDTAQAWFHGAADRAPAAQLRFYAGLVEASARGGKTAEARWWYERATVIFRPERVLEMEARCLAPGDRYLLARMSRVAAQSYLEAGDRQRQQALLDRAQDLAQPDPRGICTYLGRAGQASPEEAVETFWQALREGGWTSARRFFLQDLGRLGPQGPYPDREIAGRPPRTRQLWIAALSGGERRVSLWSQIEIERSIGGTIFRCARTDLRRVGDAWFLEEIPLVFPEPCQS
jgi:tetratricopeptide (TPR) repeat protein